MTARQASDMSSALMMRNDAAIIATPPRNGIKDFCRIPKTQ